MPPESKGPELLDEDSATKHAEDAPPEPALGQEAPESGGSTAPESSPAELYPEHLALIAGSAIAPEVAAARGYRTIASRAELKRLGFADSQSRVPALLIPVRDVTGEIATYQIRPNQPRIVNGKALKYETPRGSHMVLDVPPAARSWTGDPARPLFITEGARKADAAVSIGLCTVALLGVWNWRGKNDHGGLTALADWESIALKDREVLIVFDSDVVTKPSVRAALVRLKAFLEQRGARVRVLVLPSGDGGTKVGLDDFLAGGKGRDDLLACASLADQPAEEETGSDSLYAEIDGRIVFHKALPSGGSTPVVLSNFTARIIADIVIDDGVEPRSALQIEACLAGKTPVTFEIPSERFGALNWPMEHLGPKATVSAGLGNRDRLREAIQTLSPEPIERHHVYTHIGFREICGKWVYLHAGGGIGERGAVAGVRVRMEAPLDLFKLPAPPEGEELVTALRKSLGLLDGLISDGAMFPLFSATYTAPLGDTNESLHVVGKTGRRKTEVVALCQRHYGEAMDAEHLPGSWTSTGNAQEALASLAKDALLTVDDFNPTGTVQDIRRAHADADRIFRAQGNRSARQRMRADGSLRPPRPPRGLIVSTGEETPAGHSLRARLFVLEIGPEEVNLDRLTECQKDAGWYSKAMAAFVRWVASQRDALREERKAFVIEQRRMLLDGVAHGRTATIGAGLLFGLVCALRFARESRAIDAQQETSLLERGRAAILQTMSCQSDHQEAADPTRVFGELLSDALQSGAAHLVDTQTGGVPQREGEPHDETAKLVGWRLVESSDGNRTRTEWRPGGSLVGWIDALKGDVFLLPQAAYDAAQRMAETSPTRITIGSRMLAKLLDESGVLVTKDDGGRRTKKVRLVNQPRSVWHVRAHYLFGAAGTEGTTETAQPPGASSAVPPPVSVPTTPPGGGTVGTPSGNGSPPRQRRPDDVPAVPAAGSIQREADRDAREERAAIFENDADVPRAEADRQAGLFLEPVVLDPEASGSVGGR